MITIGPQGLDPAWDSITQGEFPRMWHYGLDGEPISLRCWMAFQETRRKIVKQERIGRFWLSTVHLGIDHGWNDAELVIFESMVFTMKRIFDTEMNVQQRYSTYEQALAGHHALADELRLFTELEGGESDETNQLERR